MKKSATKASRSTLSALAGSLACLLLAAGVYWYFFQMIQTIGEHNAALQSETADLNQKEAQVDQLKKDLTENQVREPILISYFIDANDPVPLLETIEDYGRSTNVVVKFSAVTVVKSSAQLVVSMTSDGTFPDLYRFIALVEAAPYEFSITSVQVKSGGSIESDNSTEKKGPKPDIWEATMSIAVTSITGVDKASGSTQ